MEAFPFALIVYGRSIGLSVVVVHEKHLFSKVNFTLCGKLVFLLFVPATKWYLVSVSLLYDCVFRKNAALFFSVTD